jgi:hypothetical protein
VHGEAYPCYIQTTKQKLKHTRREQHTEIKHTQRLNTLGEHNDTT